MEGELRDRSLVEALRSIGRQGKTGILTVQGADEIIAFSFLNGSIVGADALNQSLEEGLGDVLSGQHLIDPEEFARLASEQEAGGGRVVDLLVERSFLSRAQLLDSLRLHTYRLCLEALSWSGGEYRFYQGDEVAYEAGVEPLTTSELLVRASEELGEAGPLGDHLPSLGDAYQLTPDAAAVRLAGSGDEEGRGAQALRQLLDGRRTIREAAAESGLSEHEARQLVGEWSAAGLVEQVGGSPAPIPVARPEAPLLAAEPPILGLELSDVLDAPGPEPEPEKVLRKASAKAPEPRDGQLLKAGMLWSNRVFGVALLGASLTLLAFNPKRILLPFPWQGSLRDGLTNVQRSVQRLEIENGARTFFLLHGRFPDALSELDELGVIGRAARTTAWRLSSGPTSLVLQATAGDESTADQPSWTASIGGDFLLDPDFFEAVGSVEGPLLVLLD